MLLEETGINTTPAPDVLEVTLMGPGYGESVLLHVGDAKWIVIDSCVEPRNELPLPLRYLNTIGVDPSNIMMIVVTHWDDDHIRGMAQIVDRAVNARVVLSSALKDSDFIRYVTRLQRPMTEVRSGVDQLLNVFNVLLERGSHNFVHGTQCLYHANALTFSHQQPFELFSLSPSHQDYATFLQWVAVEVAKPNGAAVKVAVPPDRNYLSIVLHARVGPDSILLGADLEEDGDPRTGWSAVLSSQGWSHKRSSLFKVSHHGSETGHHAGIWSSLLESQSIAILAPWTKGGRSLPAPSDVTRITSLTSKAFLSAKQGHPGKFKRSPTVQKTIRENALSLKTISAQPGIIRLRKPAGIHADWQVELFGTAHQLE